MNYKKFQKFCRFLSTLFNILFWIIIVSALISSVGFIYVTVNYENLPNMVEELKMISPDDISEFLKYSKGYYIMSLIEFFVYAGLTAWLYLTISKTAKGFIKSDCAFTLQNYKNMKKLTSIFYYLALSSIAVVVLAGATLNETEALEFVLDETSLYLGFVFTFICFLFKQTAKPVIRTIEITENTSSKQNESPKKKETSQNKIKQSMPKAKKIATKNSNKNNKK